MIVSLLLQYFLFEQFNGQLAGGVLGSVGLKLIVCVVHDPGTCWAMEKCYEVIMLIHSW